MPNEPDTDDLEAFSETKFDFGRVDFEGDYGYSLTDAYNLLGIADPFKEKDGV